MQPRIQLPAGEPIRSRRFVTAGRGNGQARTPEHRTDPGQELPRGKWLGDVVVRAEFQTHHAVRLVQQA